MSKNKGKTEEQIFNRILINFGIAILAYILLYVLYAKFYMNYALTIAVIFFILAAVGYVVSSKKLCKYDLKNYSHMFVAFGLCLVFASLSRVLGTILGLSTFSTLIKTYPFFKMLVNTRYEVILISWLGAAYLVGMLIYNTVLINNKGKKRK